MYYEYNGELYDYIKKHIKNRLVFDIGANIGQMTKRFVSYGCKVVAVEPQKELTFNKNYEGVFSIKNVCISNKIGKSIFYKCSDDTMSSCCKERIDWKVCDSSKKNWIETTIQTTTLDSLIEEFGIPSFIKIDVEGLEDKVLEGLSNKVDFISFEFVKDNEKNAIKCLKILHKKFGFRKAIPFIKKKVKDNYKRTIKLHSYASDHYDIKGIREYLYKDFPKLVKVANRYVGDILVIL